MAFGRKVDIGNVHIHKKVIGDIAASCLFDIPGVSLARFGMIGGLCELFGYKNFPGVYVAVDQSGQISIEIRVEVDFGVNIPQIALQIQDKVHSAVEQALDLQLKEINVSVQSVLRGKS
jgi:uncharacterized alkaline shock family protein YloU